MQSAARSSAAPPRPCRSRPCLCPAPYGFLTVMACFCLIAARLAHGHALPPLSLIRIGSVFHWKTAAPPRPVLRPDGGRGKVVTGEKSGDYHAIRCPCLQSEGRGGEK